MNILKKFFMSADLYRIKDADKFIKSISNLRSFCTMQIYFRRIEVLEISGRINSALKQTEESITLARDMRSDFLKAKFLVKKAELLSRTGQIDKVYECSLKASKIYSSMRYDLGKAHAYELIGFCHYSKGEFDKALKYYKQVERIGIQKN